MKKIAVILYGPPGSGKGTQANMIAHKLGLIHLDTGEYLESYVHDPKNQKRAIVRQQRKFFDTGKLCSPNFVFRAVREGTRKIRKAGMGIVFSGSPRTLYEAEHLVPELERLYGKKNIIAFRIELSSDMSIKRNSNRLLCTKCKAPLLTAYYPSKHPKYCPRCGGPLYRRTLDTSETIKIRLEEYRNRTMPVFRYFKDRGYAIHVVRGEKAPYKVFDAISRILER